MIELKRLYLDGWLSYDKAEIDLSSPGVTLIKGNIGSGKSAILEAIFYLLFGKTLRGKDSVNSLVNRIINQGYEIALDLAINKKPYTIKEIRGRDKKGLYFYENDTLVVLDGSVDPRRAILAALGVSAQEFEAIAFLGQKQAQVLVEGTPGDRARALVCIFGLSRYDRAIEKCNEIIKDVCNKIEVQTEKVEQVTSEIKNLKKMLESATEYDPQVVKRGNERLEKINAVIDVTKKKLEKIQQLMQEQRQELGRAEEIELQIKKAEVLKKEIGCLKEQIKKEYWPEQDVTSLQAELRELDQNKTKCSLIIAQQEAELTRLGKFGQVCPINNEKCPVNVPQTYKLQILGNCKNKIAEASTSMSWIQKQLDVKHELLTKANQKEKIENTLASKTDVFRTLRASEPLALDKIESMLDKCKKASQVGIQKLEQLREEQANIKVQISKQEQAKHYQSTVTEALEEYDERLEYYKEKLKKLETENKYLAASLAILKKTKMYKIDLVIKLLNQYINEILDQISDGEYKAQFVSQQSDAKGDRMLDKIGILVADSHKSIPVELCSGGQRDEVGLSVLLATWKAANQLSNKSVSSLWLDEAFGALDQDAVDRVFRAVIDVASSLGANSVKIISHRDLDARLFDHVWHVSMKDGISSLSIS